MQRFLVACVVAEGLVILVLAWLLVGGMEEPKAPGTGAVLEGARDGAASPMEASVAGGREAPTEEPRTEPARQAMVVDPTAGMAGTLLFGRVTGKDGAAVKEGSVYAVREGESRGVSCNVEAERGYAVPGLVAGKWTLTVRAEGFQTEQVEVELTGGMQRRDLLLDATHALKVIAVTPEGEPLGRALQESKLSRIAMSLLGVATLEEPPAAFPMTVNRTVLGLGVGQ